jgi:hypothetical protein
MVVLLAAVVRWLLGSATVARFDGAGLFHCWATTMRVKTLSSRFGQGMVLLARRRHSLLGGDIGHLGCLPWLCLGPTASSSTWYFAVDAL